MDSDEEREKCEDAFVAIRNGDIGKLANLLGNVRTDIIDRNNKNNTLLHYAVEKGNENIVELFLHPKWKVNIHATNIAGNTPLHIAALKNNAELVKLLLSKGAESDVENDEGETPLDLARGAEVIGILESPDGTSRRYAAIPKSDGEDVDTPSKQDKEYEKREGTTSMRGELYEIELAMLYLLHGIAGFDEGTVRGFRLGANMKAGGNVGNLIFECEYRDLNGAKKSKITFVQTKHKENVKEEVAATQLLSVASEKDGWYLRNHFWKYQKVKDEFAKGKSEDPIFGGRFENCEFVIFTNVPFRDDFEGYEKHVSKVDVERRSIFDFEGGNHHYKLSMGGNKDDQIEDMIRSSFSSKDKLSTSRNFVSKDEIDEYFGKLKLFYGQPNESELRVILGHRIRSVYRVSPNDVNRVFADVEYKTRSWWIHENEYLTENNRLFQDSTRVSIRFGVKKPVDLFTGRDRELGELHRSLQRSQSRSNRNVISQMTCVTGLGGIGKTQLAREYIKKYSRCYDDNVIWINAESDESLRREFRRLAEDKLNIATKNAHQKEKHISSIVAETYSFFAKRRSIFVFDNADETENLEDFLPLWALPPNAERPHILITSRRNEWYDGADVVKLGEFTTIEATEFIRTKLGLDEKNDAMNRSIIRLVEVLQRFPLAIQQAISCIRNQSRTGDVNIDEYLQTYERRTQDLLDWKHVTKDTASDYDRTTYTTWKMTIEKIGETRIGQLALEILDVIAYLACDDIRREMFSTLACDNDSDLRAAVRKLVNYSMINGEERQSILHVHKLVQQVTRLEQIMRGTEAEILQKSWHLLEHDLPCGDEPAVYLAKTHLLPHCEAILLHFDAARESQHEKPKIEDDKMVYLLLRMGQMFSYAGYAKRTQELNERILEIAEKRHGRDDSRLIPILEDLGACYNHLDDPQNAKKSFERVLELRERQYGHNHLSIVSSLVAISDICEALADHQKQKELIERALEIVETQDSANHLEISHLSYRLSFAYGHLGDHRKQNELFERTLAIDEKHQPRELFEFERNLMMLLMNKSRDNPRPSDIDILERALIIVQTVYGESHFKICNMLVSLAIMYGRLRKHETQKTLLERAVEILENHFGTDHFKVADALDNLGIAHGFLGDYHKKKVLIQRALEIRRKHYGLDHIVVANTMINLADAYEKLGDLHDEKELLELALNITENHYGPDNSEVGLILANLSCVYQRLGDSFRQNELLARVDEIWRLSQDDRN